jgi:hypothetical protein
MGSCHLGVLSRIWEADIRMDVMEVECKDLGCMELVEDHVQQQAVILGILSICVLCCQLVR